MDSVPESKEVKRRRKKIKKGTKRDKIKKKRKA